MLPHLPQGAYGLITMEKILNLDSSDENNESGEGSQEKGSKERAEQKQHEENDEEDEEENESEDDWNTVEEDEEGETRKKKMIARKYQRKLGHAKKGHNKKKVMHNIIGKKKRTRRTKRNIISEKHLHRLLRKLKANKYNINNKVNNNGHLSRNKSITKKHSMKDKTIRKNLRNHLGRNKHNNKKKKVKENKKEGEVLRKRKIHRRKITKQLGHSRRMHNKNKALGKHTYEEKMKKKLQRSGTKAKVHAGENHKHQKITGATAHHVANKMNVLNIGKYPTILKIHITVSIPTMTMIIITTMNITNIVPKLTKTITRKRTTTTTMITMRMTKMTTKITTRMTKMTIMMTMIIITSMMKKKLKSKDKHIEITY